MNDAKRLKDLQVLLKGFAANDKRYKVYLRSLKDMDKIPIAQRADIRKFMDQGSIRGAFNVTATSGSTSSRLVIAHSHQAHHAHLKRLVKLYRLVGASPGELVLNLCSYELNSGGRLMEAAYKACGCGVIPLGPISSKEKVMEAAQLVRMLKPTMVNAYTNQLFDLFSVIGRKHTIRRCIVNGEPLWDAYRKRIEALGGVRVHDHYGAMEVSGFAIADKSNDPWMRVIDDGLYLEVADQNGRISSEGIGDLLVTDLYNTCMPFIRYRLGDRVELARRNKILRIRVLGRTDDSILINGVVVIRSALIQVVADLLKTPRFFCLITKDSLRYSDRMIINVCGPVRIKTDELIKTVAATLGMDRCIEVRPFTGDIPRTINGKINSIIDARKEA